MATSLPRREDVVALLLSRGGPLRARDIAARLHVASEAVPGFFRLLDGLAQEGVLRAMTGQRYALGAPQVATRAVNEREGQLSVNARGFGFVRSVGFEDDLYIPESSMGGAMHGDTVAARVAARTSRGLEGEVVRVVKRGSARVAGVLRRKGPRAWLEPDDTRVRGPIVLNAVTSGGDGDAAVARITRYPAYPEENPEGELIAALGAPGDPQVEVAKVLLREGVDEAHTPAAVTEAEAYGGKVSAAALTGRRDLTAVPLPTIDPVDARDHDDAVWVERTAGGGYTAWVAIADVSEYVRPGTAIDKEAEARGCSIYLPTRAIPMLPRALSSNLCSLLPNEIRLCLCAIITLDASATVKGVELVRGYMNSRAKLTYEGVARALGFTDKPARQPAADEMVGGLRVADELSQALRKKRLARGALDFQLPEPRVVLDPASGAPIDVEKRGQDPGVKRAYELIEELMLLANEVVAEYLVDRGLPAIFRVHAPPDETKLEQFAMLCEELGVPFDPDDARDPKKLSQLVRRLASHPRADVLNMLLLRAMKQATYDTANIGHFGLASTAYLHFTSPIRRYPDLVVHRAVKRVLAGEPAQTDDRALEALRVAAQTASARERHAMEVEREVVDLYRALYMRRHLGDTFAGTVTGVVGSGVFVTLDAPFVEVLVAADAMGRDEYSLDDERMKFYARRSGDSIGLGDPTVVTVEDVSIVRRTVYAWRHPPDVGEGRPLKHSLFKARDKPARGTGDEPPKKKTVKGKVSWATTRPRPKIARAGKGKGKGAGKGKGRKG